MPNKGTNMDSNQALTLMIILAAACLVTIPLPTLIFLIIMVFVKLG